MKSTNTTLLNALLALDIGIILVCILFGERSWLFSSQIGYWSAALVMFASMASYRRMVDQRLGQGAIPYDDDRDMIDKIGDPHDLYSEDTENIAQTIQEEKAKLKANRRSIGEVAKDSKASLSPFRILSYALLVGGFFLLEHYHTLHIPSYLISLGLPMIVTVNTLILVVKTQHDSQKD